MSENTNGYLTRRKFLNLMLTAGAAAAVQNKGDSPVVVIGGGLGGLVSAAYLANHGFPVTLLEQHNLPGGYATSFDRAAGKFTFDVSLHATVVENGIPQKILAEIGIWDKLKVVYTPEFCRIILSDCDLTLPAKDPEKIIALLSETFPGEKKGSIAGVEDGNGTIHPAQVVIANSSVPELFSELIAPQEVPDNYLKKLSSYQPSLSSFIVWLGLKCEIKEIKDYEIFIGADEGCEAEYRACLAGDLNRSELGLTIYDNLYPGYSLPGTTTLTVMSLCGYEPWKRYASDYFAGRKKAYADEKERLAQILIKKVEDRVIPNLTSMIEVMEAATPLTNIRYTGNTHGAIYGYDRQGARMNLLNVRKPIKGLYLAGAWSHGGGYTPAMMAGRHAVLAFMEDWRG